MKKLVLCLALAITGCASTPNGISLLQLESPEYFRDRRSFPLDFVGAQRAVIKHQQICGSDIEFAVDERHPGYARVTKPFSPGATGWNNTIVLGLTKMSNVQTRGEVYSYSTPSRAQLREIYQVLLHPDECPTSK